MHVSTPHPSPAYPLASDFHESDKLFYRDLLHEMLRAGVGLVRSLELRAVNATMDDNNAALEAAASYERVTRAIRRSIMLATKLTDPDPTPRAQNPAPTTPEPHTPQPAQPRPNRETLDRELPEPPDDLPAERADLQDDPESPEYAQNEAQETSAETIADEAPPAQLDPGTIEAHIATLRRDLRPLQDHQTHPAPPQDPPDRKRWA